EAVGVAEAIAKHAEAERAAYERPAMQRRLSVRCLVALKDIEEAAEVVRARRLRHRDERLQFVRLRAVVVVHEEQVLAASVTSRGVPGSPGITVGLVADDRPTAALEFRLEGIKSRTALRAHAPIVDEHNLVALVRLLADRRESLAQKLRPI